MTSGRGHSLSFGQRAVVFGLAASLMVLGIPTSPALADDEPRGYIVVFRPGVSADAKTDDVERRVGFASDFRYGAALKGFAARLTSAQLARVRADRDVLFVSADRELHTIGSVPIANGDTAPTGVRRIGAATTTTARQASTVNVAVIDSGIDLSHSDLNAVSGKNCIRPGSQARDDNGHGTHVAGSIAARNNGAGVVGVAPGTRLYAVKVVNAQGSGTDAQVICGIDWVTANAAALKIKVANMSLGGPGADDGNCGNTNGDALHRAICSSIAAGVTYVVAAGNDGGDLGANVPASYDEVLTVSAVADFDGLAGGLGSANCSDGFFEQDDAAAGFSDFTTVGHPDAAHTIAAPGVCITSTWPGGGYRTISGTSMASPHVAGVAALCFGENGAPGPCTGMTPAQVVTKLRNDAAAHARSAPTQGFLGDPDHPIGDMYYGYLAWGGAADTTPPVITGVASSAITHEAATITWTTDEGADDQVEYGTTTSYGSSTSVGASFVTSHSVRLTGLTPVTTYHYRVKSRDGWGNLAVSGDYAFTTIEVRADLALTGSASPEPAGVGDTIAYQLGLVNRGPARATGTTLSVQLPSDLTASAASASQGSCVVVSAQSVSCALGTLEAGTGAQVAADHPTGFWRLGEAAGATVAADASGNGLGGTYEAGVTLGQPGAVTGDTAATFGNGAAVVLPSAAALDLRNAFSVEAWVKPSAAGQNGGIFEKTVGGAVNSQYMLFLEAGVAKFRVRTAAGALVPVDGPTLSLGTWTHLVGTFDGATLSLYVNGALAATAAAAPTAGGSGPSYIGRLGQNLYPFQGSLDEVALFNVALSADRVRAHYLGAVAVRVTATAGAAGSLRTTASVRANENDPDPTNNTVTFTSTVR